MARTKIYIATAGWSIPRAAAGHCPSEGTHLQRYARVMSGAEVNSSFHRPHARATYEKWAASTPPEFRFAVKVPRLITHDLRLRRSRPAFETFLAQTAGLGQRRGPLLVQLPPSFAFDARVATRFLVLVRGLYDGPLVWEPRHPTWFSARADALLTRHRVARVAADPPIASRELEPGGWPELAYFRLHGSPRMYWSPYEAPYLVRLAEQARHRSAAGDVWCVFDNTAAGAAFDNAVGLHGVLREPIVPESQ